MGKSRNESSLPQIFSLRNCVLLSVLVHLVLFSFPCRHSSVKAMPGSISMALVSGAGKTGQSKESVKASTGSVKPKSNTPSKAEQHQEKSPVPEPKQESIIQPKPKPMPVVQRAPVVSSPPKKSPMEKPAPIAKTKSEPVVSPKKVVKERDVNPDKLKKNSPDREAVINKIQPVKEKDADTSKKQLLKAGKISASNKGQEVAKAGQGIHAEQEDGGALAGPLHARIGSLFGPKIARWARPKYPRKARAMGQTGVVVLRITIDSSGNPIQVEVVQKAGSGFDEAAVIAVQKSSFIPATHKGHPVACSALLPVRFNLKGH